MHKSPAGYYPLPHGAELPNGIEPERLLQLLTKVRKGDANVIEEVILNHVRLAISIVNKYGQFNYIDDLYGAAIEGVVVAVNKIANGAMTNHDNITGYIVKYIHRHILEGINHSPIIYTPRTRKKKTIERFPGMLSSKDSQLDIQEFETWDLIESLADSKLEQRILKLRRIGHTDAEIGKLVDLPRLQVFRIRHDLFQRYRRKERSNV